MEKALGILYRKRKLKKTRDGTIYDQKKRDICSWFK
jgi:hypothetical protein